jgi:MFS family permease
MIGALIHAVAMSSVFLVDSYLPFLLLEVLGGIGISIWMTSASVLVADNTRVETRGRTLAVREMSARAGLLIGPLVGGVVGGVFSLKAIFLFIAATKLLVIVVTALWIGETHKPDPAKAALKLGLALPRLDLTMFRTRAFLALTVATVSISMVGGGTGVFRTLFPAQATGVVGLDLAEVGLLLTIAGGFAFGSTLPVGAATDRYGRRVVLLSGLFVTALSVALMANVVSFTGAAIAVVVFGLAESAGWGTLQVYAMDQAPSDRRGVFLGGWSFFQTLGQVLGPLMIGTLADQFGFDVGFMVVTGLLITGAIVMYIFGTETKAAADVGEGASRL